MAIAVSTTCIPQVNPRDFSTHILRNAFSKLLDALQAAIDAEWTLDRVTDGDRLAVLTPDAGAALRDSETAWDEVTDRLRETTGAAEHAPASYAVRVMVPQMHTVLTSGVGDEFHAALEVAFSHIESSRVYLSESAQDRDTRHLLSLAFQRLEGLAALPLYEWPDPTFG